MNKGAFSGLISFQVIWDLRKLSQLDILEVAIFQTSGSPRAPKSPKEILTFAWRSILTLREHLLAVTAFFLIPKKVQIYFCKDINLDQNVKKILSSASSAFIVIRGGRILSKETLKCFEGVWVNIHGGILPFYRGLDSHLWAIARKDFDRIGVTVHLMTEKIDEGIILWKESISVKPSDNLGYVEKKLARLSSALHHKAHEIEIVSKSSIISNSDESGEYFSAFPKHLFKWTALKDVKND